MIRDGDFAIAKVENWCLESQEALREVQKWAVKEDYSETARIFRQRGVATLSPGTRVKALDVTFGGAMKVRTDSNQECWTVSNAFQKATVTDASTPTAVNESRSSAQEQKHSYDEADKRTCDVLRAQLKEEKPAGMSRKKFLTWTAKEIQQCKDLGLFATGEGQ
jgi:hypothetical protein